MANWTQEQVDAHQAKIAAMKGDVPQKTKKKPKSGDIGPKMNKTEIRFAGYILEPMRHTGEIIKWEFEPFKFRSMENKFYKPDFAAWYPDGSITVLEIKAFNLHRSSLDRFQACRERYSTKYLRFECHRWFQGGWNEILR